jgi:hypothetical protein
MGRATKKLRFYKTLHFEPEIARSLCVVFK